ncbi:cytidine deaminase-like protein [Aspergillus californicus]
MADLSCGVWRGQNLAKRKHTFPAHLYLSTTKYEQTPFCASLKGYHTAPGKIMVSTTDITHLRRCVELAREALEAGDSPFGSLLVSADSTVLKEDRNRVVTGADITLHPELMLVQWAQKNLSPTERAAATVYTSGEHCPMCATAHAYAGLGRIVYASSSAQLVAWRRELGVEPGPVVPLAIHQVAPGMVVDGPVAGVDLEVRELHLLKHFSAHK